MCVFLKFNAKLGCICGKHIALIIIEMWLVEKLYLSKGLKDGFQHVLTYIVVERPNVEFPGAFSFLQVLCLGCKPEKWWAKIRIANPKSNIPPQLVKTSFFHLFFSAIVGCTMMGTPNNFCPPSPIAYRQERNIPSFTMDKFSHILPILPQ